MPSLHLQCCTWMPSSNVRQCEHALPVRLSIIQLSESPGHTVLARTYARPEQEMHDVSRSVVVARPHHSIRKPWKLSSGRVAGAHH